MMHVDDQYAEAHMAAGSEPPELHSSDEWHEFHVALDHARLLAADLGGDFALLYKNTAGLWTACEDEADVPDGIHYDTEGLLMVWADGRIGILNGIGTPAQPPALASWRIGR